jgi:hypothetical protein
MFRLASILTALRLDRTLSVDSLRQVCELLKCDMRRILNEFQSFATTAPLAPLILAEPTIETAEMEWALGGDAAAGAVVVEAVVPPSGTSAGGTICVVRGRGFEAGVTVSVGGRSLPPSDVKVLSDTQVQITTPPAPLTPNTNEYGVYEDTFEDVFEARFAEVVVERRDGGGTGICSCSSRVDFTYEWPEMKDKLEKRERFRRLKKGLKVKDDVGEVGEMEGDAEEGDFEDFSADKAEEPGEAEEGEGEQNGGGGVVPRRPMSPGRAPKPASPGRSPKPHPQSLPAPPLPQQQKKVRQTKGGAISREISL